MPISDSPSLQLIEAIVPNKPMLTREELAEVTGLQVQSLAAMAMQKKGPPVVKLGRACRYPRPGIVQWMLANAMIPPLA